MSLSRSILAALIALAAAMSGCANIGRPAQGFALFDLGLAEPVQPPLAAQPAGIDVRTPSWLASPAMQYRLEYRQPAQREAFQESRWASPPAEMLAHALERALVSAGPRGSECRLRIDLDEFAQVFVDSQTSHAEIVARVQLLPARGSAALLHERFVIREAAPTPDAPGGVSAHRRAVQALAARIAAWLAGLEPAKAQGADGGGRCGP